jgi:hypothetical protein
MFSTTCTWDFFFPLFFKPLEVNRGIKPLCMNVLQTPCHLNYLEPLFGRSAEVDALHHSPSLEMSNMLFIKSPFVGDFDILDYGDVFHHIHMGLFFFGLWKRKRGSKP